MKKSELNKLIKEEIISKKVNDIRANNYECFKDEKLRKIVAKLDTTFLAYKEYLIKQGFDL